MMRRIFALCLALALAVLTLAAIAEENNPFTGSWSAVYINVDGETAELPGTSGLSMVMTFYDDLTYSIRTGNGEAEMVLGGEYEFSGDTITLISEGMPSYETFVFEGDLLILTEDLDGFVTVVTLKKLQSELIGAWRAVAVSANGVTVDIPPESASGMALEFRPDGSCTGILISDGLEHPTEMTYTVSESTITLYEDGAESTVAYTIDGNTLYATFSDGTMMATYTMERQ